MFCLRLEHVGGAQKAPTHRLRSIVPGVALVRFAIPAGNDKMSLLVLY
jgi:hypothetical protein